MGWEPVGLHCEDQERGIDEYRCMKCCDGRGVSSL